MATPESALEKYTKADQARKAFIEENKAVFDTQSNLVMAIIDAENELRDAVAESGKGVFNGYYKVSCVPQTQTFADIEVIDQMIGSGIIKKELRDQIVKTNERPPRISISEVE